MTSQRPFEYIEKRLNFLDVTYGDNRETIFSQLPVLILASGPSIHKNINWLVENQTKFIIITVSANLKLLEEFKIKPDVIVHIDENKEKNIEDFSRVDLTFFKDALVILSAVTHPEVMELFKNNTKFFIQSVAEHFSELGRLFSPSIGEFIYAFTLLYGSKKIYLLGLDFALDPDTNQSHYADHIDKVVHDKINDSYKQENLNLDKNHMAIKGNLREVVYTTARLYLSLPKFNDYTHLLKTPDINVYNLNDGAYLEDTISLKVNDMCISEFNTLNKRDIRIILQKDFLNNSSTKLEKYDKALLKMKLKNAKHIKTAIVQQSKKVKYSDVNIFLKDFEKLINNITKAEGKYDSAELNRILFEYTRLVGHYIYNFSELNLQESGDYLHIKEINSIFTMQVLKIVNKYINLLKSI